LMLAIFFKTLKCIIAGFYNKGDRTP